MQSFRNHLSSLLACSCLATVVLCAGCEIPEDPMLDLQAMSVPDTRVSDMARTINFVFSERQFDSNEFGDRVSLGLNRWSSFPGDDFSDINWEMDETVEPLFDANSDLPILLRNSDLSFINTDANFLQEAVWIRQISDRVVKKTSLRHLEYFRLAAGDFKPEVSDKTPVLTMMQKLNPELEAEQVSQLANALKMFDWVTRNIQLDSGLDGVEIEQDVQDVRLNDKESTSAAGIPGPGNMRYVWQTLIFARGDYVERSKLFLALCNHQGIEAAMLSIPGEDSEKLWCVGVLIGDDYFLFDSKLGMPIPGEKPGSIATLSQARSNKEILESLDLDVSESLADETDYWVKSDELKNIDALIYFAPEAVSKRMAVLEGRLVGEQRLPLVNRPADRVKKHPTVEGVTLKPWSIALDTHQFRQAVRAALPDAVTDDGLREKLMWYYRNEDYIDNFPVYRTGRARFFAGKFERESDDMSRDSVQSFRYLMYSDRTIQRLGSDSQLQTLHGVRKSDMSLGEFQRTLLSVQSRMRLVRRDAGLFLSQAHFDNGSVSTSGNWLVKLLDNEESARWKSGINYLYARSLESQHDYDNAIEALKRESEQTHGNLIRARKLKEMIEAL